MNELDGSFQIDSYLIKKYNDVYTNRISIINNK